jgi:hypothetical protein
VVIPFGSQTKAKTKSQQSNHVYSWIRLLAQFNQLPAAFRAAILLTSSRFPAWLVVRPHQATGLKQKSFSGRFSRPAGSHLLPALIPWHCAKERTAKPYLKKLSSEPHGEIILTEIIASRPCLTISI